MHNMDWDDLRVFLAAARAGALLPAARRLGVDHSTVARRISALEAEIGAPLLDRSPRGVTLTAAGAAILENAERMEAEARAVSSRLGAAAGTAGAVRLATPEAFGAYLVAPAVPLLYEKHPHLQLELLPEARVVNLTKREADLAVALNPPTHGRLYAQKLVDYRLGLYASRSYIKEAGPVRDIDDLRQRPLVWYVDELLDVPELRYLETVAAGVRTAFRSTSVVAQYAAVSAGFGIGVLHAFVADKDPDLVPVLPRTVAIKRSYWLLTHADQRDLPRIRAVAEFLQSLVRRERGRF